MPSKAQARCPAGDLFSIDSMCPNYNLYLNVCYCRNFPRSGLLINPQVEQGSGKIFGSQKKNGFETQLHNFLGMWSSLSFTFHISKMGAITVPIAGSWLPARGHLLPPPTDWLFLIGNNFVQALEGQQWAYCTYVRRLCPFLEIPHVSSKAIVLRKTLVSFVLSLFSSEDIWKGVIVHPSQPDTGPAWTNSLKYTWRAALKKYSLCKWKGQWNFPCVTSHRTSHLQHVWETSMKCAVWDWLLPSVQNVSSNLWQM